MTAYMQFWKGGWRKAECDLCGCLVRSRKLSLITHVRHHINRGDGPRMSLKREPIYQAHREATINMSPGGMIHHIEVTGWVTSDTGPG